PRLPLQLEVLPRGIVRRSMLCQLVFWFRLFFEPCVFSFVGPYDWLVPLLGFNETHCLPLRRFIVAGRLLTEDHQCAGVINRAANLKRTRAQHVSSKFICLVVPLAADKNLSSFIFDLNRVVDTG